MPVTAIVGAQWGDEGKGKITDLLAQEADLIIRFGGGSNAGHTVVNEHGEFRLHVIPSGIFNAGAISLIGTGAVVDLDYLGAEIDQLEASGIDVSGLRISDRAHLVLPYHLLLDRLSDEARGSLTIGTTRRGVGPAYVDKADRVGIRVGDLRYPKSLEEKLRLVLPQKNQTLQGYGHSPLQIDDLLTRTEQWNRRYASMMTDQVPLISAALDQDQFIVLEGQLGALRDLDWGTYPYVTSSTTIAGGGGVGGGIPPMRIENVLGVVKAYTTAVGTGPMPAELAGAEAENLRERGAEYGATTGRPRRVGWFDAVAVRYGRMLNQFTGMAVTKLDVLDGMPTLKLCTSYVVDGTPWETIPPTPLLERAIPQYEEIPGWTESTTSARRWNDLPSAARRYIERIEELAGASVSIVSVGQAREETILR